MADGVMREAACACGQLSVTLRGEPRLVSSCCCTRCQRRTGSFFGVTAYFHPDQVVAQQGTPATYRRPGGSSTVHFCPRCGSSLWWALDEADDLIGVAGGCFADPTLPSPVRMVYTRHKHPYVQPPAGVPTYEDAPPE